MRAVSWRRDDHNQKETSLGLRHLIWGALSVPVVLTAAAISARPAQSEMAPTATPTPRVMFEDDFSDATSGWEVGSYESGSVGYESGTYFVTSAGTGRMTWGVTYHHFPDINVEVTAVQVSDPEDQTSGFGVGCRIQGSGDGYYLLVGSGGYSGIGMIDGGDFRWLAEWRIRQSAVASGNAMRLRATCEGSRLALTVDGGLTAEATDSTFARGGDVALAAIAFGGTEFEAQFDDLAVEGTGMMWYITPDGIAWQMLDKADALYRQSDYRGAMVLHEQALMKQREIGDLHGEEATLNAVAGIHLALAEYEEALQALQQAMEVRSRQPALENVPDFQQIIIRSGEAVTLGQMGSIHSRLGDYQRAIDFYEQALAIDREIENRHDEAIILDNIGVTLDRMGDYEKALAYHQQALAILQELDEPFDEAVTLNNIGMTYKSLMDLDRALSYFEQALAIRQRIGDRAGVAVSLNTIGGVQSAMDDYQAAQAYYEQALEIRREIGDLEGEATSLNNLGTVLQDLGDYQGAFEYYGRALAVIKGIGNRSGEATMLHNLGGLQYSLGRYERAMLYYEEALAIEAETGNRRGQASTLFAMGVASEELGDLEGALEFYLRSIEVRESIRAGLKVEAFKRALASADVSVYQRAVRLLAKLGREEEAFDLAERNRARAFLDSMGNLRPVLGEEVGGELLQQEERLRGEIAALEDALAGQLASPSGERGDQIARSIEARLLEMQQSYEGLLAAIQLADPNLASLVSIPTVRVGQAQAHLDSDTTLVAYYMTDRSTLAFVISRQDFKLVELPVEADLVFEAVKSFRTLGLANLSNPAPRSLNDLYAWLVAPIKEQLKTPVVAIVPHLALHYVPFAALTDGVNTLGQEFVLFNLPSASVLPLIMDKAGRESGAPLILGDPLTRNPELPRLSFAAEEASRVGALFEVEPLLGSAASEKALREGIDGARVIHLAAHGGFNQQAPLFSRLWLAPSDEYDGSLNVYEIYTLELGVADLVVLSACQTQLGALTGGDEVVGLNRAFLYGAPTVVASLWSVDDESTGALMESFYRHLQEGEGKASALQAAQREVRNDPNHPEWAHPYYWAAFVLNGDPGRQTMLEEEPIPGTEPSRSPGLAILAIRYGPYLLAGLVVLAVAWLVGVRLRGRRRG